MCQKEAETVILLLLYCDFATNVWGHFISICGVAWSFPRKIEEAVESWMGAHFVGCGRTLLGVDPLCYSMGNLERNE